MKTNVGCIDRMIRIVIGIGLIAATLSSAIGCGVGSASFRWPPACFAFARPICDRMVGAIDVNLDPDHTHTGVSHLRSMH